MGQHKTRRPDQPEGYWPEIIRMERDSGERVRELCVGGRLLVHEFTLTKREIVERYGPGALAAISDKPLKSAQTLVSFGLSGLARVR